MPRKRIRCRTKRLRPRIGGAKTPPAATHLGCRSDRIQITVPIQPRVSQKPIAHQRLLSVRIHLDSIETPIHRSRNQGPASSGANSRGSRGSQRLGAGAHRQVARLSRPSRGLTLRGPTRLPALAGPSLRMIRGSPRASCQSDAPKASVQLGGDPSERAIPLWQQTAQRFAVLACRYWKRSGRSGSKTRNGRVLPPDVSQSLLVQHLGLVPRPDNA